MTDGNTIYGCRNQRYIYHSGESFLLELTMVPDCPFQFRSATKPNCYKIGSPGRQDTQTVNLGTLQWKSPNRSELGGLSAGCPVGPSVDSYNAFVFWCLIMVFNQNCLFNIQ